jgi:ribonuclease HI
MTHCYCDASCDPQTKIAIIGWFIDDGVNKIKLERMINATCASAELLGLIRLLTDISELINISDNNIETQYIVHSDSESVINRIHSKDKLIKSNFITKKGKRLKSADLYIELFNLIEMLQGHISIEHIDGHKKSNLKNYIDRQFSKVDKKVRNVLRANR